jgi:hypothetical protein
MRNYNIYAISPFFSSLIPEWFWIELLPEACGDFVCAICFDVDVIWSNIVCSPHFITRWRRLFYIISLWCVCVDVHHMPLEHSCLVFNFKLTVSARRWIILSLAMLDRHKMYIDTKTKEKLYKTNASICLVKCVEHTMLHQIPSTLKQMLQSHHTLQAATQIRITQELRRRNIDW